MWRQQKEKLSLQFNLFIICNCRSKILKEVFASSKNSLANYFLFNEFQKRKSYKLLAIFLINIESEPNFFHFLNGLIEEAKRVINGRINFMRQK